MAMTGGTIGAVITVSSKPKNSRCTKPIRVRYNPGMSDDENKSGVEYENPLVTRYAGKAIRTLFSPRRRALVWRELWIALAGAQKELGLDITQEQIEALEAAKETIDLERVAVLEAEFRHDVMAHIHHFGELAPLAKGILHLGATSCFVTDNADLIIYREGLRLLQKRLLVTIFALSEQARRHQKLACLGYTHFQPAQPTTLGKRICLWLQDLALDHAEVSRLIQELPFRGAKGTTGTQASYLTLFKGDHQKVRDLDRRIAQTMGFENLLPISAQTYPRKIDHRLLAALSGIAQSAAKFGVDFRLLSHEAELSEPFTDKQIGSSAMAYKRNPMRSERICSLARLVQAFAMTAPMTASTQWLERSLDDSAVRRVSLPEAFLAVDACLILYANIAKGMTVFPKMMQRHLDEQLPFLATEEILMAGIAHGLDRQDLHERIRKHAVEAGRRMKEDGEANPLVAFLEDDPSFAFVHGKLREMLSAERFYGRAPEQVDEFLEAWIDPLLVGQDFDSEDDAEIRV